MYQSLPSPLHILTKLVCVCVCMCMHACVCMHVRICAYNIIAADDCVMTVHMSGYEYYYTSTYSGYGESQLT